MVVVASSSDIIFIAIIDECIRYILPDGAGAGVGSRQVVLFIRLCGVDTVYILRPEDNGIRSLSVRCPFRVYVGDNCFQRRSECECFKLVPDDVIAVNILIRIREFLSDF